jgi:hypothetical protein
VHSPRLFSNLSGAKAVAVPHPDGSTSIYLWGGVGNNLTTGNPLIASTNYPCGLAVKASLAYPSIFGTGAISELYHLVLPPAPASLPPAFLAVSFPASAALLALSLVALGAALVSRATSLWLQRNRAFAAPSSASGSLHLANLLFGISPGQSDALTGQATLAHSAIARIRATSEERAGGGLPVNPSSLNSAHSSASREFNQGESSSTDAAIADGVLPASSKPVMLMRMGGVLILMCAATAAHASLLALAVTFLAGGPRHGLLLACFFVCAIACVAQSVHAVAFCLGRPRALIVVAFLLAVISALVADVLAIAVSDILASAPPAWSLQRLSPSVIFVVAAACDVVVTAVLVLDILWNVFVGRIRASLAKWSQAFARRAAETERRRAQRQHAGVDSIGVRLLGTESRDGASSIDQ